MVIFSTNDPFHFGTLTKAMITIWRVEMLTSWEEVTTGLDLIPMLLTG